MQPSETPAINDYFANESLKKRMQRASTVFYEYAMDYNTEFISP